MKGKLIAAVTTTFVLALAILFIGRQQEAKGQKQEKPQLLEYKVVFVHTRHLTVPLEKDFEKRIHERVDEEIESFAKPLNELGADGWEYVGQVHGEPNAPSGTHGFAEGVFLAFKRPKK